MTLAIYTAPKKIIPLSSTIAQYPVTQTQALFNFKFTILNDDYES